MSWVICLNLLSVHGFLCKQYWSYLIIWYVFLEYDQHFVHFSWDPNQNFVLK